jgi:class 3 adenylate cyclase/pimeloyl-ACP methyl ester carboxylesterase
MEPLDTHYARAPDGTFLAYQVIGEGPLDLLEQVDWPGNLDMHWEDPDGELWYRGLSSFSRLILHDRRGIGLSSRNVALPNLETRVADTLTVLDAVGSERPVLSGTYESGAPNALLAATRPDRVRALVWVEPLPRYGWAPDFPWGRTEEDRERESSELREWGTNAYGRAFVADFAGRGLDPEVAAAAMAKASRNACTPDVAEALSEMWYETDVRDVLPAIKVPTLIVTASGDAAAVERSGYVASLIPGSETAVLSGDIFAPENVRAAGEAIRRFIGVERPAPELDTVLSTVLFTDIVGSTERQASIGDRAWKELVQRHHVEVRAALQRWRGVELDTAGDGFYASFDGPARAIRCGLQVADRVRELGLEIRAGIHTGECERVDGKLAGLTVSIGARVASLAGRSQVLVSQTVRDLVAGSGFTFEDAGEHELKGVPDRWRLYRVAG